MKMLFMNRILQIEGLVILNGTAELVWSNIRNE